MQMKNAFALFDQTGDGTINLTELSEALRVCGATPTEEELAGFSAELGEGAVVDYNTFKGFVTRGGLVKRNHQELVVAFKGAFDRDGLGYLSVAELRQCLVNLGDKMHDEEVDHFLGLAEVDDHGRVHYETYIKELETFTPF